MPVLVISTEQELFARARELATESHDKAVGALSAADGDTTDLHRIADFIFTRNE